MKSVELAELKDGLSALLQQVREGEEIVIRDADGPIARLSPMTPPAAPDVEDRTVSRIPHYPVEVRDAMLIATGALLPAKNKMDWEEFFAMPAGSVPREVAVQAVIDSRGDR